MLTLPVEGTFPSLGGAVTWFNSKPLTPAELRGKVVLVEFWTYTCVNWLRTLPYERAWAEKYKDHGLVVIGVHTPEFSFEKDLDNIERAIKAMDITFPVAVDSNYTIWNAFDNNYWPAMYFIDAQGRIRHHHYGEAGYDESEHVIQTLLAEAGDKHVPQGLVSVDPRGLEVAADWPDVQSAGKLSWLGAHDRFRSTCYRAAPQRMDPPRRLVSAKGCGCARRKRAHVSSTVFTRATSTSS